VPILKDHLAQSQEVQSWKLVENRTLNEEAKYPIRDLPPLLLLVRASGIYFPITRFCNSLQETE